MDRLEEITLREHLEITEGLLSSAHQERMRALANDFVLQVAKLQLLIDERDVLYKTLFAERQAHYEKMFAESEKRVGIALAAKTEKRSETQWGVGTFIGIAGVLIALIALAAVLSRH